MQVLYGDVIFQKSGELYKGDRGILGLLRKNICHQGIFFRKDIFRDLGKYDTRYQYLADWVFNLKWFFHKNIVKRYIPYVIARYNETGSSAVHMDSEFSTDFRANVDLYVPKWKVRLHRLQYHHFFSRFPFLFKPFYNE